MTLKLSTEVGFVDAVVVTLSQEQGPPLTTSSCCTVEPCGGMNIEH